jgi:hypothetical protein
VALYPVHARSQLQLGTSAVSISQGYSPDATIITGM